MARGSLVTIGELLEEHAESDQEDEILERIKILAQEYLPDGWTQWEVAVASKEEIFGDNVDAAVLNKLVFALPTVGLVRAFHPDSDHLSEKGYRKIRLKLLDWSFTRALILGPPAIANRIRGSTARTELFKQSVESLRGMLHTRAEANRILSGSLSESETTNRKRRSPSSTLSVTKKRRMSPSYDKRFELLETKMEGMFAQLLGKIEGHREENIELQFSDQASDKENDLPSDESSYSDDVSTWRAPNLDVVLDTPHQALADLEFPPNVKEADPPMPEPTPQLRKEGIECQRLGTEGWNRIRYKDVEKHLHAAPVFSALKVNTELGSLPIQPYPWLTRQEGMLGTISHGLLLERKALADFLNATIKKIPSVGEDLRQLLAQNSQFKVISDSLLQFVCAHRAETIEMRRKTFGGRNEVLDATLHDIVPSSTHLFDEKQLMKSPRVNLSTATGGDS